MKVGNILLSTFNTLKYGTYGFRFKGDHQARITGIHSTGRDEKFDTTYDWDGLKREEQDVIVFQYTLKGAGKIRVASDTYDIGPGDAFFVKIPGNHRYYFPKDSKVWEFFHLTLFGAEALRCYNLITKRAGHILKLNVYDPPIKHMLNILRKVAHNEITDAYESSALAYTFLMALEQYVVHPKSDQALPKAIAKAIEFIEKHYADAIILDDIVNSSGLSKYHFTRLFHETVHSTPIKYLTETRINKAIELLKNESLTIEDIAAKIGFSNGNYFSKVFRSSIGMAPGAYRKSKSSVPIDHLIRDY